MSEIHEIATVTSKGQITLPKPIRQALGVVVGSKIAFDLRHGEVVVTRADESNGHEDPAIEAFLGLLEKDIRAGKHMGTLPEDLAQAMLVNAHHALDIDKAIDGEVAL
jgi:antitoxin PrlF